MDLRITPTDRTREDDGVWTTYRGVELLIARATNTRYVKELRRLQRPYQRDITRGTQDPKRFMDDINKAMGKAILLDWKGFNYEGEPIAYSEEHAYALLSSDSDAREYVMEFAANVDNYLQEDLQETLGN